MREVTVRTRIKWAAKQSGLKSTISNKTLLTLLGVRTQSLGVPALCSFLVWMVDFINCVHIEDMVKFRVSRTVFWKCYKWKIINETLTWGPGYCKIIKLGKWKIQYPYYLPACSWGLPASNFSPRFL